MSGEERLLNKLIAGNSQATLATMMCSQLNAPFASMVRYSQAQDGTLVLLLSDLAQHTKNIKEISRASLMIMAHQQVQTSDVSRVSLQGEITPIDAGSAHYVQRYYSYYPEAQKYIQALDFNFYRLTVEQVYWIGGYGKVSQYTGNDINSLPFSIEDERRMIEHMNKDHADAIQHYCDKVSIHNKGNVVPEMVGVSAHGFHVRVGNNLHWFAFDELCEDVNSVRQALISMAQS